MISADPRVADLVRAGKLRIALFPSFFYARRPDTGELEGLGIELARALATRIGVVLAVHEYEAPPRAVEGLTSGECDLMFLGLDPNRAVEVDFSPPCLQADFTFLVPEGCAIGTVAEADRPGLRIAVVRQHAMDTALKASLKQARPVYAGTPDAAFDLLRTGDADILAGIRPALLGYAARLPGARVLTDRYGANVLALAVRKGLTARLSFVSDFVREGRRSGVITRAIASAGLGGIEVPPA